MFSLIGSTHSFQCQVLEGNAAAAAIQSSKRVIQFSRSPPRFLDNGVPALAVALFALDAVTRPAEASLVNVWRMRKHRVLNRKPEAAEWNCSLGFRNFKDPFQLRRVLNRFSGLPWSRVVMDARARAKRYEKLDFLGEGQVRNSGLICLFNSALSNSVL